MTDFSIVLPAYNDLGLLRCALESVRCQRDVTMEIIIVDDSDKNDDIEGYVTSLNDSRIAYHRNRPKLGAVRNWNKGLMLCRGEYVIVVHHDEFLMGEGYLSNVKLRMQQCDVVVCNVQIHQLRSDKIFELYPPCVKRLAIRFPSLLFAVNFFGPCAVIAARRNVVEPFDEHLVWFVDVEWYYRLIRGHKVAYLPSAMIGSLHGHEGQLTDNLDTAAEAKKDAVRLCKYEYSMAVRFAIMVYNLLHNSILHRGLKKMSGR